MALSGNDARELSRTLIDRYLSDVTKIGDKFYIDTDYGDLSELFNTYRSDISQSTISEILSGDYIIAAINHYISRNLHECTIEVIKESILLDLARNK